MVNGTSGLTIVEQFTGRKRKPPTVTTPKILTEEEIEERRSSARQKLSREQIAEINQRIQTRRQKVTELESELDRIIRTGSQEQINRARNRIGKQLDNQQQFIGELQGVRGLATGKFTTGSVIDLARSRAQGRSERGILKAQIREERAQALPSVSAPGRILTGPTQTEQILQQSLLPGLRELPPASLPTAREQALQQSLLQTERAGPLEIRGGLTIERDGQIIQVPPSEIGKAQITTLGVSLPKKGIETIPEFEARTGLEFKDQPSRQRIRLIGGDIAVGSQQLGATLVEFGVPGFGGQITGDTKIEKGFLGFPKFVSEDEPFKELRERQVGIPGLAVQFAPLIAGAPFIFKAIKSEGLISGAGTIIKGISPIKTPTFEQFSVSTLAETPVRTIGVELPPEPITGGRRFSFGAGREVRPLFGKGGADQIQTFEALQITRPGKPPRTIITKGESVTEFADPISGRLVSSKDFFSGAVDITRTDLNVKGISDVKGFLGRGRIERPGQRGITEFPVGGFGKQVDGRLFGIDVQPIGIGVRRPTITELDVKPSIRGVGARITSRDIIRTDIEPTQFIRGRATGFSEVFLRVPKADKGFKFISSTGRRTGGLLKSLRTDPISGISEFSKQVQVVSTRVQTPSTILPTLSGPDAFVILRQRPSAFAGTGLFERQQFGGQVLQPQGPRELGTGITAIPKFDTLDAVRPQQPTRVFTIPKQIPFQAVTPLQPQIPIQPQFPIQPTRGREEVIPEFGQPLRPRQPRGPPTIPIFGFEPFGRPFIGIPPVTLGGAIPRKRRPKSRKKVRVRISPSFTAIGLDLRGEFPKTTVIGGVDIGILPTQLRVIPESSKRKKRKKPKKKRK